MTSARVDDAPSASGLRGAPPTPSGWQGAIARLAGLNALNVVLGLTLNTVLAATLGATATKDALDAAIAVSSNLVQTLGLASLGGSTLYVVGRLGASGRERVSGYLSSTAILQAVYGAVVLVLVLLFEDRIIQWLAPEITPAQRNILDAGLTWTIWLLLLRPLLVLVSSAATGLKDYGAIQFGALLERLGAILGVLFIGFAGPVSYPAGMVIGVVTASLLLLHRLRRHGIVLARPVSLSAPEVRETVKLSAPWMLTSPIFNVTSWIFIPLMLRMESGSYAAYGYAVLLNTTLVTLMLRPLSEYLAPVLAEAAGAAARDGDDGAFAAKVRRATRMSLIIGAIVSSVSVGLACPMVGVLYFRGAMTADAAATIAALTVVLGFGLAGRSILLLCARLFQAQVKTYKYVAIQVFEPIISVSIALLLMDRYGVAGIAAGASVSAIAGAAIGLVVMQRGSRMDWLGIDMRLAGWLLTVTALAGGIALAPWVPQRSLAVNAALGAAGALLLGTLLMGAAALWRVPEVSELAAVARRSLGRGGR